MKYYSYLLLAASFFMTNHTADALEIIYPKQINTKIQAPSTFFIGNAQKDSTVTINSKPVKIWDNGSFVEVVPLTEGQNNFVIEEKKADITNSLTYVVEQDKQCTAQKQDIPLELFNENEYMYASIVKDNVPLRSEPNESAKRLTHLNRNTIVLLRAKKGDYYLVQLSPTQIAWIKTDNVVSYMTINEKMLATISDVSVSDDKYYEYIKLSMNMKVPYRLSETPDGFIFEVFGVDKNLAETKIFNDINCIKNIAINTATENVSAFFIELKNRTWGYDSYYDDKTLIIKIRKEPKINPSNPLKDITIAIDPGHGGCDAGAIGPTKVKEKDINLDVAQKLKKELEKAGANVVMTRDSDCDVDLYKRPQIAQENNALFLISLHANALADGADPYKKHGTSVFYYNKESKDLALTLKNQLINDLGTKDDGLNHASFVLTRATMPMSVLIEIAYMIHPTEYTLLLDENFRQKAANSIKNGIAQFLSDNCLK